jgi:hypothetical protein
MVVVCMWKIERIMPPIMKLLSTTISYQPFSWDEGNFVVDVYQTMYSSFSYSFFINREFNCSISLLVEIVDVRYFHHCLEDISYTMVDASPCISSYFINLSQVDGFLKYESRKDFQYNEALLSTPMVMSSPDSFGCLQG